MPRQAPTELRKPFSYLIAGVLVLVLGVFAYRHLSARMRGRKIRKLVAEAVTRYHDSGYDFRPAMTDHTPFGDFLNYGLTFSESPSDTVSFDKEGVVMVKYHGTFQYNPVTIECWALSLYGRVIRGELAQMPLLKAALDKLVALQDPSGAFRYPFDFNYYLTGQDFKAGWTSGLAQGLALAVMARGYQLYDEKKYLEAGAAALRFLNLSVKEGGTRQDLSDIDPALSGWVFYDEYPVRPASYTLNGFMYILLGIYDWSELGRGRPVTGIDSDEVAGMFVSGVRSLRRLLPLYDLGGFSSYDLGHVTYGAHPHLQATYHREHIPLLYGLFSVTREKMFRDYARKWALYVTSDLPESLKAPGGR